MGRGGEQGARLGAGPVADATDLAGPAPRFVGAGRSGFLRLASRFERPLHSLHAQRKSKTLCQAPCDGRLWPPAPTTATFFKPRGFRAAPTSPEYSTNAVKNARQNGKTVPISSFC